MKGVCKIWNMKCPANDQAVRLQHLQCQVLHKLHSYLQKHPRLMDPASCRTEVECGVTSIAGPPEKLVFSSRHVQGLDKLLALMSANKCCYFLLALRRSGREGKVG